MGFKFNPFTGALDSSGGGAKHIASTAAQLITAVIGGDILIPLLADNVNDVTYTSGDMIIDNDYIEVTKSTVYRVIASATGYSNTTSPQNYQLKITVNGSVIITHYTPSVKNAAGQNPGAGLTVMALLDLSSGDEVGLVSSMSNGFVGSRQLIIEEV